MICNIILNRILASAKPGCIIYAAHYCLINDVPLLIRIETGTLI